MINKKITILSAIILLMLFGSIDRAFSSHIVGGELNYRCVGNRTFEITLIVYRDCFFGDPLATFDNPAWTGIFTPDGQLQTSQGDGGVLFTEVPPPIGDTLRETLLSECFVEGNPVCVEKAIYRQTITLAPNPQGYILVYQRCCRNETILNITEPDETGSSFWAYIPPIALSQTECNSNPVFKDFPPIFVCTNEDVDFDHSAIDFDGDEIVYEITTPSRALSIDNFRVEQFDDFDEPMGLPIPFDLVTFQPPFDLSNLLGGSSPLTIDPQTGRLTGIPESEGQFLVGISAKEYRDGVFLSETRRDFQYNVRACGERPIAEFSPSDFNCESLEVNFVNSGSGNSFEWSFGDGNTSTEMSPTYTYAEAGVYEVQLVARVSEVCTDTARSTLVINSIVAGDIIENDAVNICEGVTSIIANTQTNGEVTVDWAFNADFNPIAFTGTELDISDLEENTTVYVRITDENGCIIIDQADIDLSATLPTTFTSSISECGSLTVQFMSTTEGLDSIMWDFGDPGTADDVSTESNPSYTYTYGGGYMVTLSGEVGLCAAESTVEVAVIGPNIITLSDIESCSGHPVILNEGGSDLFNYEWRPADGLDQTDISSPTATVEVPMTYFVTISHPSDPTCSFEDTVNITMETFGFVGGDQEFCANVPIVLNPNGDQDAIYEWTPADGLDQTNISSPTATVDAPMTYYVTITDASDPTCIHIDSVNLVLETFGFVGGEQEFCPGLPVILNPDGDQDAIYLWSPADGLDSTDIASPTANVSQPTTYTVTITDADDAECTLTDSITLVPMDFGFNGSDAYSCFGNPAVLNAGGRTDLVYEWSPAEGLDRTDVANPMASVTKNTTYNVTVSLPNSPECQLITSVDVIVVDEPYDVDIEMDVVQCPGQSVTLSIVDNDARDLAYLWLDASQSDTLAITSIYTTTVTEPTTFFAGVSLANGQCLVTTPVNVKIDEAIEVTLAIDNDRVFCAGDPVTARITSDIPDTATILWEPPADGTDSATIFVAPTISTDVFVTVTSAEGCPNTASTPLTVANFPLSAQAQPGCIMEPMDIQLSATPGADTYLWTSDPVTDILDPTSPTTTAPMVDETTTFTVMVIDENGCPFEASTTVSFQVSCCQLFQPQPNYFTPNDDGTNDIFELNYDGITFISLMIYDRWGNEVFATTSPSDFWDGTNGGSDKPQDVYGYFVRGTCPDQSPLEEGGNVTILR